MGLNFKFARRDNNDGYEAFGGDDQYYNFDDPANMGDEEYSMHTEEPEQEKPLAVALKIVNPKGYDDAKEIADYLMNGNTILLNIENMAREQAVRLVDYLLGAAHALGGVMKIVGKTTIVVAPKNVDVSSIEAMVNNGD
jgi:FtsZ-interacting cell division protein YlmF